MGLKDSGLAFLLGALPIFVISVCGRATDNMVSTTLPLLGKYVFGLGTAYGGISTSAYSAAGLVANYFVNPRLSGNARRKVFLASTGLIALLCSLLSFADAITALVIGLAISFAFGIVYPSLIAKASLVGGHRGERLLAVYTLGLSVSLVLGPSIETYLLTFSYTSVFVAFALISAIAFAASWKIEFLNISKETWKPGTEATHGIYSATLVAGVFFLPFAAFTAFLPIYAAQVFVIGTAQAYASFVPLFGVSLLARAYMTARPFVGLKTPILLSFLITGFGILAMVLVPSFLLFLIVMAFLGIPHGVTYTLSLIIVSRTSAEGERNASVSRWSVYSNALNILMPLAIGYVIEIVGIHLSFLFLLVPAVVCAIGFAKWFWTTLI